MTGFLLGIVVVLVVGGGVAAFIIWLKWRREAAAVVEREKRLYAPDGIRKLNEKFAKFKEESKIEIEGLTDTEVVNAFNKAIKRRRDEENTGS